MCLQLSSQVRATAGEARSRTVLCSLEPGERVWLVYSLSIAECTGGVKWLVPVLTVVHVSAPLCGLLSESRGEVG